MGLIIDPTIALAECSNLNEVKRIVDIAEAARTYARAAKMGLEAQNHAAELKLRAERKAGELLQQLERSNGGDRRSSEFQPGILNEYRSVLTENEVTPSTAHRWQFEATVPDELFEEYVAEVKADQREVTSSGLRTVVWRYRPCMICPGQMRHPHTRARVEESTVVQNLDNYQTTHPRTRAVKPLLSVAIGRKTP
jgi:hypothetical protein